MQVGQLLLGLLVLFIVHNMFVTCMSAVCTIETHRFNTMTTVAVKQLPDLSTNVPVHTYMVVWIVAAAQRR